MSAKVVQFPYRSTADRDAARSLLDWQRSRGESATIMILPIVRIERPSAKTPADVAGRTKQRKRRSKEKS